MATKKTDKAATSTKSKAAKPKAEKATKAAKAAGANVMALGSFVTAIINFVLLAFVVFILVRQASKVIAMPDAGPTQVDLLTEIRDELRKK